MQNSSVYYLNYYLSVIIHLVNFNIQHASYKCIYYNKIFQFKNIKWTNLYFYNYLTIVIYYIVINLNYY